MKLYCRLRRALSFVLLLAFSLPLLAPLFLADAADAVLPACCRRDGKHHCMMMMQYELQPSSRMKFATVTEKCPYGAMAPATSLLPLLHPPTANSVFAGLVQHPAIFAQTRAAYRVSSIRSRQKRGPPAPFLL